MGAGMWYASFICGIRRAVLTIALPLLMAACALSDEGAVDYRKTEARLTPPRTDGAQPATKEQIRTQLALIKKDFPGPNEVKINKGDKISIRLRDGMIADCSEFFASPLRKFRKNCEIAIVVRAFEFSSTNDFNFGKDGVRAGRLVYYSSDVEPGQTLNLHNLPIYGPITYNGNPIGLDIYIIEIDAEDNQTTSLLKALAKAGSQAFPPAQPVLAVLETLGSALLAGNTDDIEFRYTMVLDPQGGFQGMSYPAVEVGNYAFVRQQRRAQSTPWDELAVDDNDGRVKRQPNNDIVRDLTWLSVQINRNAGDTDVILEQNLYGPFRDKLQEADRVETVNALLPFVEATAKLTADRGREKNFSAARNRYELLLGDLAAGQCTPARQKLFDFHRVLTAAITANNKHKLNLLAAKPAVPGDNTVSYNTAELSEDQVGYFLAKFRTIAKIDNGLEQFTWDGFPTLLSPDFQNLVLAQHNCVPLPG